MPSAIYPSLKDKRVVVTGGGSGIGAGLVEAFARQGAQTLFIDILDAESAALESRLQADGANVRFERLDLTDIPALEASPPQPGLTWRICATGAEPPRS